MIVNFENQRQRIRERAADASKRGGRALSADLREELEFRGAAIRGMELLAGHIEDIRATHQAPQPTPAHMDTAGFRDFGEQLAAIRAAGLGYSGIDPRLAALEKRGPAGASEQVAGDGGFTVAPAFSLALLEGITYESTVASRALNIPFKGNGVKFPGIDQQSRADGSRWGGILARWFNESAPLSASKPKFRNVELKLNKLGAIFYATDELISDTGALGAWAYRGLTLEAAFQWDQACLNGDGVGKPQGIMNANCLITVPKDPGQAAATVTATNLTGMFSRMLPEARKSAVWFVSPTVESFLYEVPLLVGIGGSQLNLFSPADDGAPYGRLMNRPIVPVEQCGNIGTTSDIVFAGMDYYLTIQKPVDIARSMHIKFFTDESTFRLVFRADGASALHTAVAPYNGGPTQSAFIALASR